MASRSVNKVILVGNLGRDAETKFTPSGVSVTRFSVATGRRWKDQQSGEWKEETEWHNVSLWRAENLAPYLTKGKQVYVEGRLQTRSYDDKDGQKRYSTEVVADDVILLSNRGEGGGGDAPAAELRLHEDVLDPQRRPAGEAGEGAVVEARRHHLPRRLRHQRPGAGAGAEQLPPVVGLRGAELVLQLLEGRHGAQQAVDGRDIALRPVAPGRHGQSIRLSGFSTIRLNSAIHSAASAPSTMR